MTGVLVPWIREKLCRNVAYASVPVATDEPEGEQQRSGVQASAHARRLGPLQEGRRIAAVRRAMTEHRQRDTALLVRGASVRHT
jgi:hypothetical protein